jgi:hypothetical protein
MGRTACTEPQCLYKGALYLTLTSLSNVKILNSVSDLRSKYSLYGLPYHMKVGIYISAFYYDK